MFEYIGYAVIIAQILILACVARYGSKKIIIVVATIILACVMPLSASFGRAEMKFRFLSGQITYLRFYFNLQTELIQKGKYQELSECIHRFNPQWSSIAESSEELGNLVNELLRDYPKEEIEGNKITPSEVEELW